MSLQNRNNHSKLALGIWANFRHFRTMKMYNRPAVVVLHGILNIKTAGIDLPFALDTRVGLD